jgi:hypothetical protein
VKRAFLWLVALLAGCAFGGEKERIDEARADELVLQHQDVDPGFRQMWSRNLGGRPVSEVQYRRDALTIRSAAHVLSSEDAADEGLDTAREALRRKPAWQPIDEPGLGDESFAATVLQEGVRHYEVVWRESNAAASLTVTAFDDALPLADVLELARRQQLRLERAAG